MNQLSKIHYEFFLLLKLQYIEPTIWVWMVEAMAITHFIVRLTSVWLMSSLIQEPFWKILKWQQLNALELVATNEDLRWAIEKMEVGDKEWVADKVVHDMAKLWSN